MKNELSNNYNKSNKMFYLEIMEVIQWNDDTKNRTWYIENPMYNPPIKLYLLNI